MIDRRTFLAQAAAAPLVFGLRELLAQDAGTPDWLKAAFTRMTQSGREGIVWVLPDAPVERLQLGKGLCAILLRGTAEVQQVLCEAVHVFLTPELARAQVRPEARPGDRFLLNEDGTVAAADRYDAAVVFNEPSRFGRSCALLLHGKDNERLKARADSIRKDLAEDVRAAFAKLDDDDADARSAASRLLERHAERIIPCLAWLSISGPTMEVRGRAGDLITAFYRSFEEKSPGPRLPYGAGYPEWIGSGCGGQREKLPEGVPGAERALEGRLVKCGMARISGPLTHTFVTFLAK